MSEDVIQNELYLAVLPLISLGASYDAIKQVLTLYPNRDFATSFFPDEVDRYISDFKAGSRQLTGGHVIGYDVVKEPQDDGRIIVRVLQNVR